MNIFANPVLASLFTGLIVLIIVLGVALFRRKDVAPEASGPDPELLGQLATMQAEQMKLQGALSAMQESTQTGNSELQRALNERLEVMSQRMNAGLNESREKTHESLTSLGERLAVIDRAQKNIEALGQEVNGLQAILSNKQSRGAFGEMRMQNMVEDALTPNDYSFQSTLSNGKRVDCLIHLPNDGGDIAVDSKFPLESWRQWQAAEGSEQEAAARRMQQDIKKHVTDIAGKYLLPGETADTALLFLPSEAIYADLHVRFQEEVVKYAFKQRVMIVSPTTFMAALYTISSLIKDARMREQAHLIQKEVGLMLKDVELLDKRAKTLAERFQRTEKMVEEITTSTGRITKRAERIADVDVDRQVEADVPNLKLVTGQGEE